MFIYRNKKQILFAFAFIIVGAAYMLQKVEFVFDFERFFPKGDPDLAYFLEFKESFEDDDNFLMVAIPGEPSIFNEKTLQTIDILTKNGHQLPYVLKAQSITNFEYFVKLGFGGFSPPYPAIDISKPQQYASDSARVMQDERIVGNLIAEDASSAVILFKTKNELNQKESEELTDSLNQLIEDLGIEEVHILGRANFQVALIRQQIKEFIFSTALSAILVSIVFYLIFRRFKVTAIAIFSMLISLILFLGFVALVGIKLDILSTLFPIVLIIVGVSDVVHLSNKYIDELHKGSDKKTAIQITIKEVGLATFLTSLTTAIGFMSLVTSRILPVKMFGITAALGVLLTFFIILLLTSSLLLLLKPKDVYAKKQAQSSWKKGLTWAFDWTKNNSSKVIISTLLIVIISGVGIAKIHTDVNIYDSLPKGIKLTEDFSFFEKHYAGFRPFEIAVELNEPYTTNDFEVLEQIHLLEEYLKKQEEINGVQSITVLYKTLNRAFNADRISYYQFPSQQGFNKMKKWAEKVPADLFTVLVNEEGNKTRISAKVKDVGADRIVALNKGIEKFIYEELDGSIASYKITGTGVIVDKNNEYVRESLLYGLAIAFFVIGGVMVLLFKDVKMLIISLIPNVLPLLVGGALMGFLDIALDAPTAIIFAISFGIAVDDTIHFLSKYKIERLKNKSQEEALYATVTETGKAIIITSIILFFGFLILLFSKTPGIRFVGILVSTTLFTAVIADVFLLPVLIRKWLKE